MEQIATANTHIDMNMVIPKFEGMYGKEFLKFLSKTAEEHAKKTYKWIMEILKENYLVFTKRFRVEANEKDIFLYLPVDKNSEIEFQNHIPIEYAYFAYSPYRESFVLYMNSLLGKQANVSDDSGPWMATWSISA